MTYDPGLTVQRLETLQTLHDQAAEASGKLAVAAGGQQQALRQAQAKLDQLERYAAQYREEMERVGAAGASWSQVRDLRGFVDRIDAAIAAQKAEIERLQQVAADLAAQWTATRQREKAFEVLIDEHQARQQQKQKVGALKNLQEWALRRVSQFRPSSQQQTEI